MGRKRKKLPPTEFVSQAIYKYLLPEHLLLESIIRVQDKFDRDGKDPGSDRWLYATGKFNDEMLSEVKKAYNNLFQHLTGGCEPPDFFPYDSVYVTDMWVRWRKDGSDSKANIRADLGAAQIPQVA